MHFSNHLGPHEQWSRFSPMADDYPSSHSLLQGGNLRVSRRRVEKTLPLRFDFFSFTNPVYKRDENRTIVFRYTLQFWLESKGACQ